MHDPRVPETFEGWSMLHQMFRVRWAEWGALPTAERDTRAEEAARALAEMRRGAEGTTVPVTMLGHKGDLMLIHFAASRTSRRRSSGSPGSALLPSSRPRPRSCRWWSWGCTR